MTRSNFNAKTRAKKMTINVTLAEKRLAIILFICFAERFVGIDSMEILTRKCPRKRAMRSGQEGRENVQRTRNYL